MLVFAVASASYAMKADRGSLSGVSADDIRSKNVPAELAQSSSCSKSEMVKKSQKFSSLGSNYLQVGAAADLLTSGGNTEAGIDAKIGGNLNLYESKSGSQFGVDLYIPLEYSYIDTSDLVSEHVNLFTFPAYLRPYYNFDVTEDFSIRPFVQAGVGGRYTYISSIIDLSGVAFIWAVGGGVEFCIFDDFYVQGKYLYSDSSASTESIDYYITPEHEISVEIGYRISQQISIIAQYSHVFWRSVRSLDATMDQDKIGVCARFTF